VKRLLVVGIILVLLFGGIGVVSAAPFTNGGFESPLVTNGAGWDIFPDGFSGLDWDVQWANDPAIFDGNPRPDPANAELQTSGLLGFDAQEGDQYAELDTDWDGPVNTISGEPANVTMSQNIDTVMGATYRITYYQRCRTEDTHVPCHLLFEWTGGAPETTDAGTGAWEPKSFDRLATGSLTTISFTGAEEADSYGALLDNVTITMTSEPNIPVPEFPTLALPAALIVGFIGAVLFIRCTKEY